VAQVKNPKSPAQRGGIFLYFLSVDFICHFDILISLLESKTRFRDYSQTLVKTFISS
jgi:hypothetical protein